MAVNATVGDVPEAATIILGIPGRLWLRALTAVGELQIFYTGHLYTGNEMAKIRSTTTHHYRHDSRHAKTKRNVSWRISPCKVLDHLLLWHDCFRYRSFDPHDCVGLEELDGGSAR